LSKKVIDKVIDHEKDKKEKKRKQAREDWHDRQKQRYWKWKTDKEKYG